MLSEASGVDQRIEGVSYCDRSYRRVGAIQNLGRRMDLGFCYLLAENSSKFWIVRMRLPIRFAPIFVLLFQEPDLQTQC